ncbi:MAG: YicC family protein [Chitinispirillaceae bacterium]|nr:YicC family protein [Chitinispirillaceae bacterium]
MPLRSMTGFGLAEASTPSGTYRVEIRAVNNRFFELQLRQPRFVNNLEQQVRKEIQAVISRGSLNVIIACDRDEEQRTLSYDKQKIHQYVKILREIKKRYKLKDDVSLENLASLSDIIKADTAAFDDETAWKHIRPVLAKSLAAFQKTREKEGAFMLKDLKLTLAGIEKTLRLIENRAPVRLREYSKALQERISRLSSVEVDPARMAVETAVMADRLDISEECTRLRAHLAKFSDDLRAGEPAGKRLSFLLQEMNREANTIGSKANDTEISHLSVSLKEDIEKIREQIQNIE